MSNRIRFRQAHHEAAFLPKSLCSLLAIVGLIITAMAINGCGGGAATSRKAETPRPSATPSPASTPSPAATPFPLQTTQPAETPPRITTSPELYPAFDSAITDYVLPATADNAVQFTVDAPESSTVSVDGQMPRSSSFVTQVNNMGTGQRFSFVVKSSSGSKTYHVRRLPADFPLWTTERLGTPQAEYYIFAANLFNDRRNYVVLSDNYGVPLWWYRTDFQPVDAKLLPNGNPAWIAYAPNAPSTQFAEERTWDGTLVRTLKPVAPPEGTLDVHDLLLLPNKNYLLIVNENSGPIDLSPYGGSPVGTIINHLLQEVTPAGEIAWQWSMMEHIPVSETLPQWWPFINDPYHINSVERDGNGYILSMRHLDAVLRIDRVTGAIAWKLGGIPRPESLTFIGGTLGNFGGQHDARILSDGTLTVHDNGTEKSRAPRAVRYKIDTVSRTATLVEQVTDSAAQSSGLVGSARKLPEGNWVTAWGGNPYLTEQKPDGNVVLRFTFPDSLFTYRAPAVPFGTVGRDTLRGGMDAQFPR